MYFTVIMCYRIIAIKLIICCYLRIYIFLFGELATNLNFNKLITEIFENVCISGKSKR